jgi:tetratricopeptide (TPR) repeat protein
MGNLETAERQLNHAKEARTDLASVHFTLALIYEKQGLPADAEREYLAERELYPENLQATFNLARLFGRQGRLDEQIDILEELVRFHPEWAVGFFHLAKAYRDTGGPRHYRKALEAANHGLALDSDSDQAPLGYFIRAEMLDRAGRKEEAQIAFRRGKTLEEKSRRVRRQ